MDNAELAIGIDLGTTNSLIAVWKDGAAQLIPNAGESRKACWK